MRLLVSVSLLGALFWRVDVSETLAFFPTLDLGFLSLAIALLLSQSVLSTLKWKTLLATDGIHLGFFYLLKTYLIGNFLSLFLPTSFGGDVYRVAAVNKASGRLAKTTSSVLFDRLTGLFALCSIAGVAYLLFPGLPFKWAAALALGAGVGLFWLGSSGVIVRRFPDPRPGVARSILKIFESFNRYASDRRCLVLVVLIAFVFQLNVVVINKVYSLTLGLDIAFGTLLLIIPLIYLTEAVPFTINGLGLREGAFVLFYQLVGQTAEAGLSVALLVLTCRYGLGLLGGTLFLLDSVRGVADDRARQS